MVSSLVRLRTEGTGKIRTTQVLDRLGLSLPSCPRMCVSRLNQGNGIPLGTKLDPEPNPNIRALNRANRIAEEYRTSDMILEEISAEITEARKQMSMKYSAVTDTNVLVSAILKQRSALGSIIELAFDEPIAPILNEDIGAEYRKVLLRPKFHLAEDIVSDIIDTFHRRGLYTDSEVIDTDLPDPKDRAFYEVVMEERRDEDAYLVTGNVCHFSTAPFIIASRRTLDIILRDREG